MGGEASLSTCARRQLIATGKDAGLRAAAKALDRKVEALVARATKSKRNRKIESALRGQRPLEATAPSTQPDGLSASRRTIILPKFLPSVRPNQRRGGCGEAVHEILLIFDSPVGNPVTHLDIEFIAQILKVII